MEPYVTPSGPDDVKQPAEAGQAALQKDQAATPAVPGPTPSAADAPPAPVASQQSTVVGAATPQIADDVDVIEKEWVDQAEQAVKKFSTDPYHQEEAIEDLQIDYLKKRYGKDVKKSEG